MVGEIRAKFRLTNAIDAGLHDRGLLPAKKVRSCKVDALVDTGAVLPVIPRRIVKKLGIGIKRQRRIELADGRRKTVDITEPIEFTWDDRSTAEEAFVVGDDVLIGQTVLEKLDLLADCTNQQLVPNPKHPEGPVLSLK
jgi:clan AA aspartic protease